VLQNTIVTPVITYTGTPFDDSFSVILLLGFLSVLKMRDDYKQKPVEIAAQHRKAKLSELHLNGRLVRDFIQRQKGWLQNLFDIGLLGCKRK